MEKINASHFKNYTPKPKERQKGDPRNEREEIISDIVERINSGRVGTGFHQTTYLAILMKTKHLSDFDLKWHYRECLKANNFSKCFFGRLKVKNEKSLQDQVFVLS